MTFRGFSRRQLFGGWASLLAVTPVLGQANSSAATKRAKAATASAARAGDGDDDTPAELLALANHILVDQDVLDGYGHISIRDPNNSNRYLLSRSLPPAMVEDEDILTFDLDSNQVGKASPQVYAERFIHGEIYRARPDVMAIVYSHAPEFIPFGVTDTPLRPLSHMTSFLGGAVPVFDVRRSRAAEDKGMYIHDSALGRSLAGMLGDHPVVLMRGDGCVIVGSSLSQVVGRSVYLKIDAATLVTTMALQRPINFMEPGEGAEPGLVDFARIWKAWKDEQEERDELLEKAAGSQ